MKKRNKFLLFTAAAAGAVVYSAIEGRGIFNKTRFKKVHEAVSGYVETHYPHSFYSPISATKNGYITTINTGSKKVILYITTSPDGIFVFEEKEM